MWLRGGDEDREAEAGEIALPEVAIDPMPPATALARQAGAMR